MPYRAAEGLRITARSRGQRAPRTYVVRAPSGDLCQLGEEEHFLFTMLDGKRSFGEIEQEFRSRFAGNLSPQHFQGFIDELQSAGIILRAGDSEPAAAQPESAPLPIAVVEEAPPAEDLDSDWTGEVAPSADTIPLYPRGLTLGPLFMLLARLGSPLRFFAWFLIPAAAAVGIALYVQTPRLAAALAAADWRAPSVALYCLGAVLAALLVPNLARGAAAAFHGAPREAFQLTLAGHVVPWFRIDRGWIGTLSRKTQAWTYGAPLLARLAGFAIGAALWLFAGDPANPLAVAGLVIGGVGLWSFLLTATPLWRSDGRRWLAVYFDEPTLNRPLWRSLRIAGIESFEMRGRGFVAVAAVISAAGIVGAVLLWGAASWDGLLLVLAAARGLLSLALGAALDVVKPWLAAAGGAVSPVFGPVGEVISPWLGTAAGATSRWFGAVRDGAGLGAVGAQPLPEIGGALLGGAYAAGLLWLNRAAASAGALRLPARGGWGGAMARGVPDRSTGRLEPMGRGPTDALPPSLDERLYAGGQSWPSNTKVLIAAAVIVAVLSIAFLSYPYESGGTFTILPYTSYEQDARVAGEVTEVLVREGEWVNQGQIIATLADWNEVHSLAVVKATLEKASAQLQDLLLLPKPEQVALARQQYEQAASRLPFSKADYERDLALVQTGAVSVRQFGQTQSTYEQDKAAVAVTKANYDLVRVGATQPEIEAARAAVRLASAQVAYAEDQLARTRIRATASGTVVTPNPQLQYGKFLKLGQTFVLLQDNRVAHVEVQVPETDIREIYIGSPVRAKAWGYEHTIWTGKVTLIARDAMATQSFGNIVRVVAEIPNPEGLLRPQMSGYAKVQTVEMPVWISFTRALVRFVLIEVWSWIP